MASDSVPFEGVRLQAARVVRAFNELRSTAKNSDFTSDEFPVGMYAELFTQIRQLEGWLEPAEPAGAGANRVAAVRDLTAAEAGVGLHAETVREIQAEYPDADVREVALRVAIRESVSMTPHEEERAYELISAAVKS